MTLPHSLCGCTLSCVLTPEAGAVTPRSPLWYTPGVGIQGLPLWKDWSSEQEGVHTQDGHHTAEGPQEPGDSVTERKTNYGFSCYCMDSHYSELSDVQVRSRDSGEAKQWWVVRILTLGQHWISVSQIVLSQFW